MDSPYDFSDPHGHKKPDTASNDSRYDGARGTMPPALARLTDVTATCRRLIDAPLDLAVADLAFAGLALAVASIDDAVAGAAVIAQRVTAAAQDVEPLVADGATVYAFTGRKERHLLYLSALAIGRAATAGRVVDPTVLRLSAARFLLRLFADVQPSRASLAKSIAAIEEPASSLAKSWSEAAQSRALVTALRALHEAISSNPATAAAYGLARQAPKPDRPTDPVAVFNRAFRRRCDNLREFATLDAVAAAGGYGTLSPQALRDAGAELMAMVEEGDRRAALVCLEIVTHLPSDIVLQLPIQHGNDAPKGALAWLNATLGTYSYVVFRIVERAARVEAATEHLYESSTQVVTVHLSPPLARLLAERSSARAERAVTVRDLLGDAGHHARSAVVGSGAYRVTARRLQESVATLLVQRGHHRWPVALATNSAFLVSSRRPSYGVCRSSTVAAASIDGCDLLGWPAPHVPQDDRLIGGFTAPKRSTVSRIFNHLVIRADRASFSTCVQSIVDCINRHSEWIGALLALTFALRRWLVYGIEREELRNAKGATVNDKDVHDLQDLPVPIIPLVTRAMRGYDALIERAVVALRMLGDARALAIASHIDAWRANPRPPSP